MQGKTFNKYFTHVPRIDNPIAVLRDMNNNQEFDDDEMFFYTKDHLGSIRELVGLDGKLKQRQRYSAYGVTTREKNTDQMDKLIDHAYGFTGRELDSETGLYFYRSRYYSPEMQRFTSEDSMSFAAGDTNLYRYVAGNPLLYVDPSGKICLSTLKNIGYGALIVGGSALVVAGPLAVFGVAHGLSSALAAAEVTSIVAGTIAGGVTAAFAGYFAIPGMQAGISTIITGVNGISNSTPNGDGKSCKKDSDDNTPWYKVNPDC